MTNSIFQKPILSSRLTSPKPAIVANNYPTAVVVSTASSEVGVENGFAYLSNDLDGLRIYDVSNPTNPVNAGHLDIGGQIWGVDVEGHHACLANSYDGLRVYEILTRSSTDCTQRPSGLVAWWPGAGFALDVGAGNGFSLEAWIKPNTANPGPIFEWNSGVSAAGTNGAHFWISVSTPSGTGAGSLFANLRDTSLASHVLSSLPGLVQTGAFQHVALTPNEIASLDIAGGAGKCYTNDPAPVFVQHPQSRSALTLTSVALAGAAMVTPRPSYQWLYDGTPLADATNATLTLNNLSTSRSGDFTLVASNLSGSGNGESTGWHIDDVFLKAFGPLSDLHVSSIVAPETGVAGGPTQIFWVITNQGNATVSVPWTDTVLLSTSPTGANAILLASFTNALPLDISQCFVRTNTVILPVPIVGGPLWHISGSLRHAHPFFAGQAPTIRKNKLL